MANRAGKKVVFMFDEADRKAAEALRFELTSELVSGVKSTLKSKSEVVKGNVQFYALMADDVWTDEEFRLRLYGAGRLLMHYTSNVGIGISVPDCATRVKALEDLIFRLTVSKPELQDLPLIKDIKSKRGT